MGFWKKLSSIVVYEHPRITLVEDDVLLPNDHKTKYLRFENLADYSTVIAERDNHIAFIKEYSYPLDRFLLQFPEGSIEEGEEALLTAERELAEEAGLSAAALTKIGESPANHRRSTEVQNIFLAKDVTDIERAAGDIEEVGTETVWVPKADIPAMIRNGEIVQKNALAALSFYFALQQK